MAAEINATNDTTDVYGVFENVTIATERDFVLLVPHGGMIEKATDPQSFPGLKELCRQPHRQLRGRFAREHDPARSAGGTQQDLRALRPG